MEYLEFIRSKQEKFIETGFEISEESLNDKLFDFQKHIVSKALKKGRFAIFADCGLGKTAMQLEWGKQVYKHENRNVLIVAPLAVATQTVREGHKFGIDVNKCRTQEDVKPGLNITNYEMLEHFDADEFVGIILDESSILKAYSGKIKNEIINKFRGMKYKLACTATPSPNDTMELLNHSEFLDILKSHEALAIWFINDTMQNGHYRLKGHAAKDFWKWVSSWGICIGKPSDLGYSDAGYNLPKLNEILEEVDIDLIDHEFKDGMVRKVETNATAFNKEKRFTADKRAKRCAEICNGSNEQFVIWCETNYEADLLKKYIPDAVEIRGSDKTDKKEKAVVDFLNGNIKVLISKVKIFGYGINFQNCHNTIFCGLSYSYENYYQAIRRFYRFGQKNEVNAYIVIGETEKFILDTIRSKKDNHEKMKNSMYKVIKEYQGKIKDTKFKLDYERNCDIKVPSWLKEER